MALNYTETSVTVVDEVGNRPPLTFSLDQLAEIDAAAIAYSQQAPPAPDWEQFMRRLQSDNGFPTAWSVIMDADSRAGINLIASLNVWRAAPDQWAQVLTAIGACLLLLPAQQAPEVGLELLALAHACHLDPAFLAALEAMLENSAGNP